MNSFFKLLAVSLLSLHFSLNAQASDASCVKSKPEFNMQNSGDYMIFETGKVSCNGRACFYLPKKATPQVLAERVDSALTGTDIRFLDPDVGYIKPEQSLTVRFWHHCQDKLDEMKRLVVSQDQPLLQVNKERIQLALHAYEVTVQKFNDFSFGLFGILDGNVDPGQSRGSILRNGNGGTELNFAFGNLTTSLLNVKLNMSNQSSQASRLWNFNSVELEGDGFRWSENTVVYRDNALGNITNQEQVGFQFGGRTLLEEVNGKKYVIIKDISLRYATLVEGNDAIANAINDYHEEIMVEYDKPYLLFVKNIEASGRSGNKAFPFSYEKSKFKTDTKVVVFVTAYPVSNPPKDTTEDPYLNEAEIKSLPAQNSTDLLSTANFYGVRYGNDPNASFDAIRVNLDLDGLDKEKMNQHIKVTISGKGLPRFDLPSKRAQNLVAGYIQFPSDYTNGNGAVEREIIVKFEWRNRRFGKDQPTKSYEYTLLHDFHSGRVDVIDEKSKR